MQCGTRCCSTGLRRFPLQKFPFVTEKVGALPARRYAVIVDEAHSSQSGESAAEMKGVLAGHAISGQAAS